MLKCFLYTLFHKELKNLSFFPLEVRTHSSFLKGALGTSIWSTSSLLTPAPGQELQLRKVRAKWAELGRGRLGMHTKQAPFLKSAPESPSTTYECLSLSLNQKQEGEDLELASTTPPPPLKFAKYHLG